ncbi:hypothetical protein KC367_g3467 [Hortaea werneckii]|nr:hypothetical protein KC367_g3467 [Hortaea werneckii]
MNNSQFRNLLLQERDQARGQDNVSEQNPAKANAAPHSQGAKRSFMPMTPRKVKGGTDVDFARQVRERNAALGGSGRPASKKFKSRDPRGVKLGAGYTDRAKAREDAQDDEGEEGSKAARIKALEEQVKLDQISQETFEALRDEITGGDVSSTHLVKGLDRRLLERVRRGEDVLGTGSGDGAAAPPPDVDEELDKLGEQEVQAIAREKNEKKGNMAAPAQLAGKKRSRNEIMAELKAQRQAAAAAKATPSLDSRWRKVGEKQRDRIEIDAKGREVLITVDEDGIVKKKVRKVPEKSSDVADMPDASKPVLGADADISALASQALPPQKEEEEEEEEDDDIFEGVGTDYDPLGNVGGDEDDDDSDEENSKEGKVRPAAKGSPGEPSAATLVPAPETTDARPSAKRNYFGDSIDEQAARTEADRFAGVENLLKKAAQKGENAEDDVSEGDEDLDDAARAEKAAKQKKRAAMLEAAQRDRDMEDMDMGFGSSRYEDEAEVDAEGSKTRLSQWKGKVGGGEEDEGWEEGGSKEKRKRKPKKRKGDANNAADIMRVIEGHMPRSPFSPVKISMYLDSALNAKYCRGSASRFSPYLAIPSQLYSRSGDAASAPDTTTTPECPNFDDEGKLVISRATFIITLTISIFFTLVSLLLVTALLYREWSRRRETARAKTWGRKSIYRNRISYAKKAVDLEFSSQYSGCLVNVHENPEMGTDSPVEIGAEQRIWEAPAVPARTVPGKDVNKIKPSLHCGDRAGYWMPHK